MEDYTHLANRGYVNVFGTDIQTGTDFLTEIIGGWIGL